MGGRELTVVIEAVGLSELKRFYDLAPKAATESARIAINQSAERVGLKLAQRAMVAQVNFPKGYFGEVGRGGKPNFGMAYRATNADLAAGIAGRQEPTSLARFATERRSFVRGRHQRGTPVTVNVHPGRVREFKRNAFFLRLKNNNIGLGIRLKDGESLTNTRGAKLITSGPLKGVALLYGPSVDQIFRTVAVDISPEVLDALTVEFLRQFELRTRDL